MLPWAQDLFDVASQVRSCAECGNLDHGDICSICLDTQRDYSCVCVVEDVGDLWAMERAAVYRGVYHILGGTLSALNGSNPETLLINSLIERVKKNNVKEVIIATSATIEGQTTAHYINDSLQGLSIKITKLAHGLPVGSEIEYLDDGTLFSAFKYRNPISEK